MPEAGAALGLCPSLREALWPQPYIEIPKTAGDAPNPFQLQSSLSARGLQQPPLPPSVGVFSELPPSATRPRMVLMLQVPALCPQGAGGDRRIHPNLQKEL